jgi:hypothetical protein
MFILPTKIMKKNHRHAVGRGRNDEKRSVRPFFLSNGEVSQIIFLFLHVKAIIKGNIWRLSKNVCPT